MEAVLMEVALGQPLGYDLGKSAIDVSVFHFVFLLDILPYSVIIKVAGVNSRLTFRGVEWRVCGPLLFILIHDA